MNNVSSMDEYFITFLTYDPRYSRCSRCLLLLLFQGAKGDPKDSKEGASKRSSKKPKIATSLLKLLERDKEWDEQEKNAREIEEKAAAEEEDAT